MRILITGSQGQVGHCLVKQLSAKKQIIMLACTKDDLDITDRQAVINKVNAFKPSVIINAAAYTAVDGAESDVESAYAVNRDGPKYLAEAAEQHRAALLHVSTDYVFSGTHDEPYRETDQTDPHSVYGASKLAGELAVQQACAKHIILRTAWVFGEHGGNFVKTMLRLASQKDELNVVDDQVGGPTYAGDIASALISIAQRLEEEENPHYGTYHFSGTPHVSWCAFASAIFSGAYQQGLVKKVPKVIPITTAEYPTPAKRPANSRLDTTKIMTQFSISPSNWQRALRNLSDYQDKCDANN
ncbi:dTDP-4-dehydrorhamnose reductase [Salinivibrio sp. SS2]|uniref:dTDP-4-dehydrorhamnose reductase n=1 Tax=Salinivibrio sp. SS2 TaxID=1892894 RepID=UPI00084BD31F|nr:dTDP-4-dehydrorhamnose reductase [Salinivibrio sp. DV]ODP99279.1 dTDP-4-dehydrorhamnose reductase [Salinivibrio sp. DV]